MYKEPGPGPGAATMRDETGPASIPGCSPRFLGIVPEIFCASKGSMGYREGGDYQMGCVR